MPMGLPCRQTPVLKPLNVPFLPSVRPIAHNGGGGTRRLPAHNARESGAHLIACIHVARDGGGGGGGGCRVLA